MKDQFDKFTLLSESRTTATGHTIPNEMSDMTYDAILSPLCVMNLMNFVRSLNSKAYLLISSDNITPTQYGTIVIDIYDKANNNLSIEIGDTLIGYFIRENGEYTVCCEGVELIELDWSILNKFIDLC